MGKVELKRKYSDLDYFISWLFFNGLSINYKWDIRETSILKIEFSFKLKVVPGPEADSLMKSWVAERDEER